MKVAACQVEDVRNDVARALSVILASTAAAERAGCRLVSFPECFLQGYDVSAEHVRENGMELTSPGFSEILHTLRNLAPVILFGLIERRGESFHNSAVAVHRGQIIACYRKAHLLPSEEPVFAPGDGPVHFDVGGIPTGMAICYDLNFPQTIAATADGADLIVAPCNNMLRRENAEIWKEQHNAIRSCRARESASWILSSDVTGERDGRISYGPTALINPQGVVVAQVPLLTTGMIVEEIS